MILIAVFRTVILRKTVLFFRIFKELFRGIVREIYWENIFWKAEIFKLMTEYKLFSTYAQVI